MRRFMFVILLVLLLTACGAPTGAVATAIPSAAAASTSALAAADPCSPADLQAYRGAYSDILGRWSVALVAASKAPPASLKTPISQLQAISSELTGLKPPLCAQQANVETAQAMKQMIEGYQDLMAGKDVGRTLSDGIDMLALARAKINALPGTLAATPTFVPTLAALPTLTSTPTPTATSTPTQTPTPEPRNGVIDVKQSQLFETATSTVPIKTLFRGTRVLVFEAQKGRVHIRVGQVEGWISQGAVIIQ
jgi:hypothetical protein